MSVRHLLSSLLFHPGRVSLDAIAAADPASLVAAAGQEQIVPMAWRRLKTAAARDAAKNVAPQLEALGDAARRWAIYEELQRRAAGDVLDRLSRVPALFFKGASLAYSAYETPSDRMRMDWDLLVEPLAAEAADRALRDAGFVIDVKLPLGIRFRQQTYRRAIGDGECAVDLHTGVFNAPVLADRIVFSDLAARSIPLPALHPAARGVADADALVLAALHRLVHHAGEARLVWDMDIRLLASRVEENIDEVVSRAGAWLAGPLVASELSRVFRETDEAAPPAIGRAIERLAAQRSDVTSFVSERRARSDDFMLDWRSLGWRERLALARQTFFPDRDFVRASAGSTRPLPLLYVRRLIRGARAWFRRP